jgi:hypothetical protein
MNKLPPKFIAERIVLCVTCLYVVAYLVLKQFGKLAQQPDLEMSMLLAMVVLLLVDALLASWRRYDDERAVSDIRRSLERLEEAAKRAEKQVNASVSKPPSSIEDYKALYSGFTGIYSAFNPSYTNEGKPGLRNDKLIDEIFYPRFAHYQFEKAHYLFFTGDDDGLNHLDVFRTLMKKVREKHSTVSDKLEVRHIKKRSSDDAEFYVGTKEANPCAIVKTKDASLNDQGNPRFYLVLKDKGLNAELQAHFDFLWNQKDALPVTDFWKGDREWSTWLKKSGRGSGAGP